MSDADILVHKDDVETVKQILIDMGYVFLEDHKASHHIALVHHKYPVVEVHWHLFKRDGFSNELEHYERLIWKRAIDINVGKETDRLKVDFAGRFGITFVYAYGSTSCSNRFWGKTTM